MGIMFTVSSLGVWAKDDLVLTLNPNGKFEYNQQSENGLVTFGNDFSNMLPGETRTATMKLNNQCDTADFYISTETIDVFENANATNGAYDLKLIVGENTIYDSSLGGYTTAHDGNDKTGLLQLNYRLQGYVYATTLNKGQTADVLFSLTLDGESVTNQYMSTDAKIHFDYQAIYKSNNVKIVTDEPKKEVVEGTPSVQYVKTGDVTIVDEETAKTGTYAAKTGDTYEVFLYGTLFLAAMFVCLLTMRKNKKNKEEM